MSVNDLIKENQSWVTTTFEKIDQKMRQVAIRSREKLPYSVDKGVHTERQRYWWTNGFWGGIMCLMYNATKNEEYKITAKSAEKLLDEAFNYFDELHHDVGFMWHLTSSALYRLTNEKGSRNRALIAASILASRFNFSGKYIRAWNGVVRGDDSKGLTIIDSMLNLPLLYWASKETGDDRFYKVAVSHADMTMRDHVREDGTVNHVVVHNPETGEMIASRAGQGYSENSAWSRGQGWAIYGFVLSYLHTKEQKYLSVAKKVADEFIKQTEKTDWIPKIDFSAPSDKEGVDTSAGVLSACGFIEIAKITGEEKYLTSAIKILKATVEKWCDFSFENDGLLFGSSESYAGGWHKNIIYGDFYLIEALLKLKDVDFLIW